ncbi:MAG: ABC transporter permease [Microthrixaceae bacterium]
MWHLTLRNLRANLTRLVSTAVAVITGTTFVACGLVLTQAVASAVAGNVELQYASVDAAVVPTSGAEGPDMMGGVDAGILGDLEALPEVSGAAAELVASTQLLDADGDALRSQMLGRSWILDDELNPFTVDEGRAPETSGEIAVDRGTAADHDIALGDTFDMATPSGPQSAEVVGITSFGSSASADGGGTVFFAPEAALDVLGAGSDQYSQILLRTDGSQDELAQAARDVAPANVWVLDGDSFRTDQTAATKEFLDFLRPVLVGFAFLALFVAGFVIYNTFTVVVTQRSRELALVRSIGGTPAQVRRSLLGEGLILGVVSSVIGLALGVALSMLLQWILVRFDIGLPSAGFALSVWAVVITVVSGTLITVVSVLIPAFRAGRTRPVEAMRAAAVDRSGTSMLRLYAGGALLVLGIGLLLFNRFVEAHPLILGFGMFWLFWGVVVGGPLLARIFGRLLKAVLSHTLTGRIAADNMVRNPKRTATTANALVIGLFLVTLVTVSGTALRDWTVAEVSKLSESDFMVVAITPIPDDVVAAIDDVEGVVATAPVRTTNVTDATGVTAALSGADIDLLNATMGLKAASGSLEAVANGEGAAATSFEQLGEQSGSPGDSGSSTTSGNTTGDPDGPGGPTVDIGGPATATPAPTVGQVYLLEDTAGEIVEVPVAAKLELSLDTVFIGTLVNEELFAEIAGDQPVSQVYVRADQDRIDEVGTDLENVLDDYTGMQVVPGNFIGQLLGSVIDFMIAAINGLLGLSVVIAIVGIINTMNLSIHERRRELGMVRALGMTVAQVRSMVRVEALGIGVLGTLIGVASGVFCGWVVIGSITDTTLPLAWGRVGIITAVGLVISIFASIWPARRSTKVPMLEAMADT